MRTIETSVTVTADGLATVDGPLHLPVGRHQVVVLVDEPATIARDERGWPLGFFEDSYGLFADEPLHRPE